jgi:hypothetical protein
MLYVEIAQTPREHAKGLMFRESLDWDRGMLFKFTTPEERKFWGMNTYIPLDIAFVDETGYITKISEIKPVPNPNTVSSGTPCSMVIEANHGFFRDEDIKEGDYVEISECNEQPVVLFKKNEG